MKHIEYYKSLKHNGDAVLFKVEFGKAIMEVQDKSSISWNPVTFSHPKLRDKYVKDRLDRLISISEDEVKGIISEWR